jgi:predicted nucleic acid-binding protein
LIVLDASAAVDFFTHAASAERIAPHLESDFAVHVPGLFDLEVLQSLRGLEAGGTLSQARTDLALRKLTDLRAVRYDHGRLRPRIWELRSNLTAYDAAYVALAELLDATLLTTDAPLARSSGHAARIEVP